MQISMETTSLHGSTDTESLFSDKNPPSENSSDCVNIEQDIVMKDKRKTTTSSSSDDHEVQSSSVNAEKHGARRPVSHKRGREYERHPSFGHAAAETYLLTRLTFKLLAYLGVGYRWIARFLALVCYGILLLPAFLQVAYYYYFSSQVQRSIVYGEQPRNRLDLYLPINPDGRKPVVIFVTGGAWIIGYKAWGTLLGKSLSERDFLVACLDYRNFPQGTISDMIKDISQGISFLCNNISAYGGDPDRIYLVGQSAGAHISSCALLEQATKESQGEVISWRLSQIKACFALSGGYNLLRLVDHFHNRGLYRSIFLSVMEGEKSLQKFSPELVLQDKRMAKAVSLLPHVILFHGTKDHSIPSEESVKFADTLKKAGARAELFLYEGKTHTDLIVQDPLRGGKNQMLEDMIAVIHAGDDEALSNNAVTPPMRRLVPEILLKLAGAISPF